MILFFMVLNVDFIYFVGRPLGRQCDGLNPNLHSDKNIKENSTTTCYNRAKLMVIFTEPLHGAYFFEVPCAE